MFAKLDPAAEVQYTAMVYVKTKGMPMMAMKNMIHN